jgi:hypothetical protein
MSGRDEEAERCSRTRLASYVQLTRYQGLSSGGFTVSSLFSRNTDQVSTLGLFHQPFKLSCSFLNHSTQPLCL